MGGVGLSFFFKREFLRVGFFGGVERERETFFFKLIAALFLFLFFFFWIPLLVLFAFVTIHNA